MTNTNTTKTINVRLNTANGSDDTSAVTVDAAMREIETRIGAGKLGGVFALVEDTLVATDSLPRDERDELYRGVRAVEIPEALAKNAMARSILDRIELLNSFVDWANR